MPVEEHENPSKNGKRMPGPGVAIAAAIVLFLSFPGAAPPRVPAGPLPAEEDFTQAARAALDGEKWADLEKLARARLAARSDDEAARAFLACALAGERRFSEAAAELEALDKSARDEMAAKILASMTEKKAALIFDAMKPEVAIALKKKISAIRFEEKTQETGATP